MSLEIQFNRKLVVCSLPYTVDGVKNAIYRVFPQLKHQQVEFLFGSSVFTLADFPFLQQRSSQYRFTGAPQPEDTL